MLSPHYLQAVFNRASCLYSQTEVEQALNNMGKAITKKLQDSNPIFLCVVTGGIIPLGQLLTRLQFPLQVDYIHITRYQSSTQGGDVEQRVVPKLDLKDRTIVIVDDILDKGITLETIINYCQSQGAKDVYSAVLVDKQVTRLTKNPIDADFYGLKVDDQYVFGYGLDYKEYFRNVAGIYAVAQEDQ